MVKCVSQNGGVTALHFGAFAFLRNAARPSDWSQFIKNKKKQLNVNNNSLHSPPQ